MAQMPSKPRGSRVAPRRRRGGVSGQEIVSLAQRRLALRRQRFRAVGAPQTRKPVFDFPGPLFLLCANGSARFHFHTPGQLPGGQKRFPISHGMMNDHGLARLPTELCPALRPIHGGSSMKRLSLLRWALLAVLVIGHNTRATAVDLSMEHLLRIHE